MTSKGEHLRLTHVTRLNGPFFYGSRFSNSICWTTRDTEWLVGGDLDTVVRKRAGRTLRFPDHLAVLPNESVSTRHEADISPSFAW